MNKCAEAAIQRKWDSDFKIALKVHTPEPPTDELIEKYRIYGTVSDAIHAWLRQREEVISISSDSTSANPEGASANPEAVTRKNSSITETSSDRQQELKKKKPKSNTDNDVESITSSIASKVFSISDDSKSDSSNSAIRHGHSTSAGKPKSILKPATRGGSGSTAGTKVGSGASLKVPPSGEVPPPGQVSPPGEVPPPGVIESDDDDYDSDDSDFILIDEEEEASDHILEEEKEKITKKYFYPPRNYVLSREKSGINTLSICEDIIERYIKRTDPENKTKLMEMRWRPQIFKWDQDKLIDKLVGIHKRFLWRKDHPARVTDILDDIHQITVILCDQDWLPDHVNKIVGALQETHKNRSENSSPTILLAFKLMCPKLMRHLNAGSHGDENNGPTEKACKVISNALLDSITDCGSPFLKQYLSFESVFCHERSTCPCTSPSFLHQGCGWETNREGITNAFLRNLLVQLCTKFNCTMIWLNFNGANGEFAFDLQDHKIVSYKKLFHPSLATYANFKVYGNQNNQKQIVSRRVRGLADYLGTQLVGDRFDKPKFLATVSESTVLPMIDLQYNTPVTESNLPPNFVTKVREQRQENKCIKYKECRETIQAIGIINQKQFKTWCRNNRQTRKKLRIPSDPNRSYKNHGWTTWPAFFGTQPFISIAAGNVLSFIDCAIVVQGLEISSEPIFRSWCSANSDLRQKLGIPSNPHATYKDTGWSTWPVFLGTLPDCIQCRNEQKECVYSIAESQCQRCTVLEHVCTVPAIWDLNYTACWNYKQENGGNLKNLSKNKRLYNWLSNQFVLNKNRLSADQKNKLYTLHKGKDSAKMSREFINWFDRQ